VFFPFPWNRPFSPKLSFSPMKHWEIDIIPLKRKLNSQHCTRC
jgi:hypothetical protein